MEYRDLRIFTCVVDEGSFTAAARRLQLAQSGISDAVARLERETGTRLLDRGGRGGSRTTPQGEVLLRWARRLLSSADRALEEVRAAEGTGAGIVRVGFLHTITPLVLPRLLTGLRACPTPVSLRVTEGLAPSLLAQVRDGRLDLAVTFFPADPTPGVEFVEVGERPLCVIVAGGSDLGRRTSVPIGALADQGWVTYPPHNPGRLWLEAACATAGFLPRIAAEVETATQQRIFVAAGIGIAMVPMRGALSDPSTEVAEVLLEAPVPPFRIGYGHVPEMSSAATATAQAVLESVLDRLEVERTPER